MIELATLVEYFEETEEATREGRALSEKSRDYYDGPGQLDTEMRAVLAQRKQPAVVFNMIGPKIDFLIGTVEKTLTDPKAFPRTPDDEKGAEVATDGIRFVLDNNEFEKIETDAVGNLLIEGTEAVSVEVEIKNNDFEIVLKRIAWDRFGVDHHAMERDGSDARYTFVVAWKDIEEAKAKWGKKAADMGTHFRDQQTYDDKPTHWWDRNRKRVMCVDMYFVYQGLWHHAIFYKGAFLEGPNVSPYVDEFNVPQNPHIFTSAKVSRDGIRYGAVPWLIDMQDVINKSHSKATHILNSRQTYSKEGRITDIDKFKAEANKPDGHLEFPNDGEFGKDFGTIPTEHLTGPHFSMYQDALQRLDSVSANAALAGRVEGSISGRAVQAMQQGGMIELGPMFGAHSRFKKRIYEAVWQRMQQFWRNERWVRVTGDEENPRFVGLNVPVTMAEKRVMAQLDIPLKQVREEYGPELQQLYQQMPEMQQVVDLEGQVSQIAIDIILEEVPDIINLQGEQMEQLAQMYAAAPDDLKPEMYRQFVEMSSLRGKNKILGKNLSREEKEAQQQQQQMQQAAMQMQFQGQQLEMAARKAKTVLDEQKAEQLAIENFLVLNPEADPVELASKIATLRKRLADAEVGESKARQTDVETQLLLTSPPPDKVAII